MQTKWWAEPVAGDIVWCKFPENLAIKKPCKPRPALILVVYDDEDPKFTVKVIFGTSQKTERLHSGEFLISKKNLPAYQLAGLSYDTKFNLKNVVDLPYNSEWFAVPPTAPNGQIPKLGTLHPSLARSVQAAYAATI